MRLTGKIHHALAPAAFSTLAALLALAAQNPGAATVRGTIVDPDGSFLPGVQVTVEGEARQWAVFSDAAGRYTLGDLPAGSYDVRAELDGFCPGYRRELRLAAGEAASVDFSMGLTPVSWDHRYSVPRRLREAVRRADFVGHIRITKSLPAELRVIGRRQEFVTITHEAQRIGAVKPKGEPSGEVVRFVQYPTGTVANAWPTTCGSETPYAAGEEYVAFLDRNEDSEPLVFLGPRFMIPIRQGRVVSRWLDASDVAAARDGMGVGRFLDILRTLRDEVPEPETVAAAHEARVAALRYLIDEETGRLARAGLPRNTERLTFCLSASQSPAAIGAVPSIAEEFMGSFGEATDPPPEYAERLRDEAYDLVPRSACNDRSDIGSPINRETGLATRGILGVGPAHDTGDGRIEIPVSIYRHRVSSASGILYLETIEGGWRVVRYRFVWGS